MLREYLIVTQEDTYGTIIGSPVIGTSQFYIRLDESNAFTMRPARQDVVIQYGGGYAAPAYTVSDKQILQGALRVKLCYSQAAFLLGWGMQKINSSQNVPWTTGEPVGDLVSATVDHAYFYDDTASTFKMRRYTGVKVASGRGELSADSQVCTLTLQLMGGTPQSNIYDSSVDPTLTPPTAAELPFDYVLFTHSGGGVNMGSALTKYESLNFDWNNKMDARFFANHFVSEIRSLGREISLELLLKLDSSPDFRTQYESIAPLTTSVALTNGAHTITLNWHDNPVLRSLQDDLQIDKIYFRTGTLGSQFSPTAGTDFDFTYV